MPSVREKGRKRLPAVYAIAIYNQPGIIGCVIWVWKHDLGDIIAVIHEVFSFLVSASALDSAFLFECLRGGVHLEPVIQHMA